jgi:hypothetical protein
MLMPRESYALSIKQPWAGLLVEGRKTIEIRRWATLRRGRVLLHAARVPDSRSEAWNWVTDDLRASCAQIGGIIGWAELVECRPYRSRRDFKADCDQHLNDPSWFEGKVLYGFVFARVARLPFRPLPGWVRFFRVDEPSSAM